MKNQEEFEAFYSSHYGLLVGQLFPIAGNGAEAEEAVQEAFCRAAARWSSVREYEQPAAWIRRVALHVLADRGRAARRRLRAAVLAPPPASVPDISVDGLVAVEALRRLPLAQRQVVVLHYVLDLAVEEVARELDVPVGTMKFRLSRARTALGELLVANSGQAEVRSEGIDQARRGSG